MIHPLIQRILKWFEKLEFVATETVRVTYVKREMTPAEVKAFDEAFDAMDVAMTKMETAMDTMSKENSRGPS